MSTVFSLRMVMSEIEFRNLEVRGGKKINYTRNCTPAFSLEIRCVQNGLSCVYIGGGRKIILIFSSREFGYLKVKYLNNFKLFSSNSFKNALKTLFEVREVVIWLIFMKCETKWSGLYMYIYMPTLRRKMLSGFSVLLPWKWKQQVLQNVWWKPVKLHGFTCRRAVMFVVF